LETWSEYCHWISCQRRTSSFQAALITWRKRGMLRWEGKLLKINSEQRSDVW
jgi:hypothetical protein